MPIGAVVTDLDGTLLSSRRTLSDVDRRSLETLGERGVTRIVATGRSLHSARQAVRRDWPIDYLVFSSGAGALDWRTQRLIHSVSMSPQQVGAAIAALQEVRLDFMVHEPIPDNHCFTYWRAETANPDFERRVARYREFASPWAPSLPRTPKCQLLAIHPDGSAALVDEVRRRIEGLTTIRTTSPLDGVSIWIEIFGPGVSKATASRRILEQLGDSPGPVVAIGNDHNDEALLAWADRPFVVANSPPELRARHRVVSSNDSGGFSEAVALALTES
jgi:hypothetical protein